MSKTKYNTDYYREYNKKNLKRISLSLSLTNDQDIIKAIETESPDNIQAGVKSLIRKAIQAKIEDKYPDPIPC
jgi:hypothetical protein